MTTPPGFGLITPDDDDPSGTVRPPSIAATAAPIDADVAPIVRLTGLDALRAELATEVDAGEVTLDVPTRAGWSVRYTTDVTYDQLTAWQKRATDRNKALGVDEARLAGLVLANKAIAILDPTGVEVTADGDPVTFASATMLTLTASTRAADAARAFYGKDGHVIAAAQVILARSGFGDTLGEQDDEDPTRPSTRS